MKEQFAKLRRKLEHFLRTTSPINVIKIIDYSRKITKNEKDKKLLEVPDNIRDHYKE